MRFGGRLLAALAAAAVLLGSTTAAAAGRYDPRLRFRALRTAHFTIYYHQQGAPAARRLAIVAEQVRAELAVRTGLPPPRHTHVVLVDQSDIANGWSTPVPYNLIEIAAVPPPPSSFLGHHDDWLRIVFTHEFAHILHLDQVGGAMKGLRWALGRSAASFPNLFVPQWQVEGFATWAESAVTGLGRVHAADVTTAVSAVADAGRASIDRAGGGRVAWPSGNTPYFQGGLFNEDVASRDSSQALGDIARNTARRIPFLGGPAYAQVLKRPAGDIWRELFRPAAPASLAREAGARRLTHEGFIVTGPRIVRRGGDPAGASSVYFSAQGPHRFPDIRSIDPAGGPATDVTSRFDGQVVASDGRWLFYDQLEFDGAVALVSDLYARDLASGRVVRLSHGARLTDPDISRPGTRLAAIRARGGAKRVTVWRLARGALGAPALEPESERAIGSPDCQYATPRWSPGGDRLAAVRQCPGALPEIVHLAVADETETVIASGGRNVTPAWSPDGRYVAFASDRGGGRFRLYAADTSTRMPADQAPRLVLDVAGGAMWPDIDRDGATVVFTSQTADGWDVFAATLPAGTFGSQGTAVAPAIQAPPAPTPAARGDHSVADGPTAPARQSPPQDPAYSPWATLWPRGWSPLLSIGGGDVTLGATAGATDALGYHAYNATAMWWASGTGAAYAFDGSPIGWEIAYAYNRWRPSFLLTGWSTLDTVAVMVEGTAQREIAEERSRGVFTGIEIPWRRVRLWQSWLAGVEFEERFLPGSAGAIERRRNGMRAGWALNSSRQYGYSVSPEDGLWTTVNVEGVMPALSADGEAWSLTWDVRGYHRGFAAHHVAALRLAGASSSGDAAMRRTFDLGGTGVPAAPFAIGNRAIGLLRGLPQDAREGPAALVANVDYRFPIARVERGIRPWPLFIRDIHGAAFADVGSAGNTLDALPAAASSLGGELAARLTLGYTWNLSVAAGAAWVRDPGRPDVRHRLAAFVRMGYAF